MAAATPSWNLGFLTVLHEPTGYVGGYLVTNQWGRPLEFRLSTAVQPNRVQQILYGDFLEPYLYADLIGKTLIDKTSSPAQVVVTDKKAALDLRLRLDTPVLLVERGGEGTPDLQHHPRFPQDGGRMHDLLERVSGVLDLAEPFARVRGAIAEARKLGVAHRG